MAFGRARGDISRPKTGTGTILLTRISDNLAYKESCNLAYPEFYNLAYPEFYNLAYPEFYNLAYPEPIQGPCRFASTPWIGSELSGMGLTSM